MISYELGQVVRSKAGRDKDAYFLIVDIEDEYLHLSNGQSRRLELPKRKKKKHVQITHLVDERIAEILSQGGRLSNADIRKSLTALLEVPDGQ